MKSTLLIPLLSALAAATLALPLDAQGRRERRPSAPPKLENVTWTEGSFESKALGGKPAEFGVFLPKGYDDEENAEKRYPLIVWLHGMFEDHRRFLHRGGGKVLDDMIGEGELPEVVMVCADGDRSSFWTNAVAEGAAYEDLVTEDLLAHITKTYRVRDDRNGRAIMGVSMGGYGALKIALKDPALFGTVAVHSAAVLPAEPDELFERFPWLRDRGASRLASVFGDPIDVDRYREENVLQLAEEIDVAKLDGLRIYFDCGTADRYDFDATNQQLHELLERREIPHVFRLVEDGGHSWGDGATQAALPHSLAFVAAQFAQRAATQGLEHLLGPGGDGR